MLTDKQKAFLARSIASLGLSGQAERELLSRMGVFPDGCGWNVKMKLRRQLAEKHTVAELYAVLQTVGDRPRWSKGELSVLKRFENAGFDRIDLMCLSQKTLTLRRQKRLSADEWRPKPLCLLGTLSDEALFQLMEVGDLFKDKADLTVQDLFAPRRSYVWARLWKRCYISMQNTRKLLRDLGFRYEDGEIMQYGTLRQLAERYERRYKISSRLARKLARVDWRG